MSVATPFRQGNQCEPIRTSSKTIKTNGHDIHHISFGNITTHLYIEKNAVFCIDQEHKSGILGARNLIAFSGQIEPNIPNYTKVYFTAVMETVLYRRVEYLVIQSCFSPNVA